MKSFTKFASVLLCTTAAVPAWGQQATQQPETAAPDATAEQEIIVTGIRESLQSSALRKKNTLEVVDSITADDIGKLPDNNVAATLSRVPGVQAYRFGGESASPVGQGSGLTIRGLSGQTASRVDGRAYITAGGREFNVEGASPGMVAGIDVYKNPSAEHIEGGIGGLVDIRTRRPFDFKGTALSASVGGRYNDLGKKVQPELFALGSTRWKVGDGEMGLLLAGSYSRSFNRGDNNPAGGGTSIRRAISGDSAEYASNIGTGLNLNPAYVGRSDVVYLADVANPLALPEAQRANLVSTVTEAHNIFQEDYMRTRKGLNGAFQYKPTPDLEFYVDGNYNYYQYHQNYRFLNIANSRYVQNLTTVPFAIDEALANRNANGGANELLSGTRLATGTFLGSGATSIGGDEKSDYTTWLIAGGVRWQVTPHFDAHFDYSYVKADRSTDNRAVTLSARSGLTWDVTRDLTTSPAQLGISGPDLASPSTWVLNNYANGTNQAWDDVAGAAALDLRYRFDDSPIKAIKVGVRYSVLEDRYRNYSFSGRNLTTDGLPLAANQSNAIPVTAVPDLFENSPTNFMNGKMGYSGGYLVFSPDALLGDNVRARFPNAGILPEDNLAENLLARRFIRERTYAGYAVADYGFLDDKIRGNIGVRAVRTETFARAMVNSQSAPGAPIVIVPNETSSSYWDVLPTANLAWYVTPKTIVRLGYGKGITRPSVDALNPTITVDTNTGLGSRGNSELKPQRADSYDISLEHYFSSVNYVAAAFFYKRIKGFFSGISNCETVATFPPYTGTLPNGCTGGQYFITQTVNAATGNAKGVEISGQTFFDYPFLPDFLHKFGVAGSFTYVDTKNPLTLNGQLTDTPQPFTSKYNWTASGLYEDSFLSARIVYTYRSKAILFGVAGNPIDGRYIDNFGLLDASVTFNLPANFSLSFSAENLTNAAANRYVGEPALATGIERQHFVNGRNFSVTLRYRFGS
ncbi:TonB-dependent receptor [Sphingomonas cannabina]|uniref:TonB-dependent receptor n=1 Tax=Sphingomonas cannabina TaxID=2899123 RepID=UPI001F44602A|nr:TonB-dependent receptor [Sphingomonas cannabina]UIJ47192.1 TonB-dependent receptor [Sphingomonas cannabina]